MHASLTEALKKQDTSSSIKKVILPNGLSKEAILAILKDKMPGLIGPVIAKEIKNGTIPLPDAIKTHLGRIPDVVSKLNAASGDIARAKSQIDKAKESGDKLTLFLQIVVGICSMLGFERGSSIITAWYKLRKARLS